jgi:hypothetical protein
MLQQQKVRSRIERQVARQRCLSNLPKANKQLGLRCVRVFVWILLSYGEKDEFLSRIRNEVQENYCKVFVE